VILISAGVMAPLTAVFSNCEVSVPSAASPFIPPISKMILRIPQATLIPKSDCRRRPESNDAREHRFYLVACSARSGRRPSAHCGSAGSLRLPRSLLALVVPLSRAEGVRR
jgi:hypothetical protein